MVAGCQIAFKEASSRSAFNQGSNLKHSAALLPETR